MNEAATVYGHPELKGRQRKRRKAFLAVWLALPLIFFTGAALITYYFVFLTYQYMESNPAIEYATRTQFIFFDIKQLSILAIFCVIIPLLLHYLASQTRYKKYAWALYLVALLFLPATMLDFLNDFLTVTTGYTQWTIGYWLGVFSWW